MESATDMSFACVKTFLKTFMNTFFQLLNRIGDALSLANMGNRFELERLMRARREDDLAQAKNNREGAAPAPTPCSMAMTPHTYSVSTSVDSVKWIKESMA